MSKMTQLKGAASFVTGLILSLPDAVLVLMLFQVIDFVIGTARAAKEQKLSHDSAMWGAIKKILVWPLVLMSYVTGHYLTKIIHTIGVPAFQETTIPLYLGTVSCIFFIAGEGISVIRNSALLGIPVPPILVSTLAQMQKLTGKGSSSEDIIKELGN